jgi:hypothetical protein
VELAGGSDDRGAGDQQNDDVVMKGIWKMLVASKESKWRAVDRKTLWRVNLANERMIFRRNILKKKQNRPQVTLNPFPRMNNPSPLPNPPAR